MFLDGFCSGVGVVVVGFGIGVCWERSQGVLIVVVVVRDSPR